MAGVLSRPNTSEGIREYFRKNGRRSQDNQRQTNSNDQTMTSRRQSPRNNEKQPNSDTLGIQTGKPRFRLYSTIASRIASFENWPDDKTQNKEDLAEAGFAYTGIDDSVRCYFCSIGLKDWPERACPWEQHILASPKCGHVIRCKGVAYVKKILGDELSNSDIEESDDVVDIVQIAMKRNKDAVSVAREYCADEDILRAAVKEIVKHDLQTKISAVELVKTIDNLQERDEQRGESNVETDGDESEHEEEIFKENRKLKDPMTCKICLDGFASIITLPCGHMISCSQCISALSRCALCRAEITGTVRALMAV